MVNLQFGVKLHKKDRHILELIQAFFMGIGNITSYGEDAVQYRASSIKDLQVIVDHFNDYPAEQVQPPVASGPLITQKLADYHLFKQVVLRMKRGKHLTY